MADATKQSFPSAQNNKGNGESGKKISLWKYKLIIILLFLTILGIIASAGYLGFVGYTQLEGKKKEVMHLKNEIDKLNSERDLSLVDLQNKIDEQNKKISELEVINNKLTNDLNAAKAKIEELTPKDIRDLDYKKLIKINEAAGDTWLNPTYVDINGDGRLEGIFAYKTGGPGGFLNVYVYSYLKNNNLSEILKAEEYLKGTYSYIYDENVLEIRSQVGTPDAPATATTRFKWDAALGKMVKI